MHSLRRLGKYLLGLSLLVGLAASSEASRLISVPADGRKLAVTLSGSSTGNCAVDGNCFSSLDYTNMEVCDFTMGSSGVLNIVSFYTGENVGTALLSTQHQKLTHQPFINFPTRREWLRQDDCWRSHVRRVRRT